MTYVQGHNLIPSLIAYLLCYFTLTEHLKYCRIKCTENRSIHLYCYKWKHTLHQLVVQYPTNEAILYLHQLILITNKAQIQALSQRYARQDILVYFSSVWNFNVFPIFTWVNTRRTVSTYKLLASTIPVNMQSQPFDSNIQNHIRVIY